MTDSKKIKTIVLTGGGTGGHVFPLVEIARSLKERDDYSYNFIYLGSGNKLELDLAKRNNIEYKKVLTGKFRRNLDLVTFILNIADIFKLIAGYFQAIVFLFKLKPDLIFSKGGYVSLPTVLAGAFWQIPILVHESDISAGLANRIGFGFARRIAFGFPLLSYPEEYHERGIYCGIPLRQEFLALWKKPQRDGSYLLIFGGSSGAKSINDKVFATAEKILEQTKIVHITGNDDFLRAKDFRKSLPEKLAKRYEIHGFVHDMPDLIYRSSAVVMRAGATAMAEVGACRKRALLIPLDERVGGHQKENALFAKEAKLALYLPNSASEKEFLNSVAKLTSEKEGLSLEKFYFPYSSHVLSQLIVDELRAAEFRRTRKYFLIGVMGVSMSGLSKVLRQIGKSVEGSDVKLGGHSANNITEDLDGVVYSSAATKNGLAKVEFDQAQKYHIPIIKRSEMIGTIMRGKKAITVSGMHGKTTITSIISRIFEAQYNETSYLIGAPDSKYNEVANYNYGGYFVVEACEYDSSFLDMPSEIAVISNIEKEHLDYFKNLEAIKKAFGQYIDNIYPGGALVYCADDKITYELVKEKYDDLVDKRIKITSYGFKPTADIVVRDYKVEKGKVSFSLNKAKDFNVDLNVGIPGKHFALNCAAAVAVGLECSINELIMIEQITFFQGASRRFEKIGKNKKAIVYDDYGHHPTEILLTTKAMADMFKEEEKVLVYQPHQQNRFNELYEDFVKAFEFSEVSKIFILPVYRVEGRDEKERFTSQDLVARVNKSKPNKAVYVENYDQAVDQLNQYPKNKMIVMTMGATDVWKVGEQFLKKG